MKPKGHPKTGGRLKGTPNKNRQELVTLVESIIGRAPIEELCRYYQQQTDESLQLAALKEICSYCHPKLRAVEHSAKDGETGLVVSVQRVDLDERKKQLKGE